MTSLPTIFTMTDAQLGALVKRLYRSDNDRAITLYRDLSGHRRDAVFVQGDRFNRAVIMRDNPDLFPDVTRETIIAKIAAQFPAGCRVRKTAGDYTGEYARVIRVDIDDGMLLIEYEKTGYVRWANAKNVENATFKVGDEIHITGGMFGGSDGWIVDTSKEYAVVKANDYNRVIQVNYSLLTLRA